MKMCVFGGTVHMMGRICLFFLSLGAQLIIISWTLITLTCFFTFDTFFETQECYEARRPPLLFHFVGEFLMASFHVVINTDRLICLIRKTSRPSKTLFIIYAILLHVLIIFSFAYAFLAINTMDHFYSIFIILGANITSLTLEVNLYKHSKKEFVRTRGIATLANRYEISAAIQIIRKFLPASITSVTFKFIIIIMLFMARSHPDDENLPQFYYVLNTFWNSDCALFPWFFIMFHPNVKDRLPAWFRFVFRLNGAKIGDVNFDTQNSHFNKLKSQWA